MPSPYRRLPNGTIECDTLEELEALEKREAPPKPTQRKTGNGSGNGHKQRARATEPKSTTAALTTAINEMTDPCRSVLRVLKAHDSMELSKLRAAVPALQESAMAISGVLSGIQKACKRQGVGPETVVRREARGWGPKRVLTYHAGPALSALEEFPSA